MSYRKQLGRQQYSQRRIKSQVAPGQLRNLREQLVFDGGDLVFKTRYFTHYPKNDYWHVNSPLIPNSTKWGFDSTAVTSKEAWQSFLEKEKFKLIDQRPEHNGHAPRIYRNPDGIYLVTSNEGPTDVLGNDETYFLGYMRFEAPKEKEHQLYTVLRDFRGPKPIGVGGPVNRVGREVGIVSYVKEETPNEAPFI